jgi:hypothetical protein
LFFGLFEELRCGELTVLEWNDVTELEMQNALLITVLTSKTDKAGESFEFIISSNLEHPEICSVRLSFRYKALFPSSTGLLWITFRGDRFIDSHLGRNTISDITRKIAHFLYLPNPHAYTGHGIRRTSATILASFGI